MSIAWVLKTLFGTLLLPPGNGLLLLAVAAIFRRRRWAFGLALSAGLLLLAQSTPIVAQALIASLEREAGPVVSETQGAGAIVVLGSGLNLDAAEYGGDTANERTLVRLRYGAYLARHLDLPLLVTGGTPLRATNPKPRRWPGSWSKNWASKSAGGKRTRGTPPTTPGCQPKFCKPPASSALCWSPRPSICRAPDCCLNAPDWK
jgi:hypothetical protein